MLNLHNIVRGAITANYPDATFTLYRSIGQKNVHGIKTSAYVQVDAVKGNFQSEGDATLNFAEKAGQNSIVRKLYLFADADNSLRPWSLFRPLSRSGDYIQDKTGVYWFVESVIEDYSDVGWVSLRCIMQQTKPNLVIDEVINE